MVDITCGNENEVTPLLDEVLSPFAFDIISSKSNGNRFYMAHNTHFVMITTRERFNHSYNIFKIFIIILYILCYMHLQTLGKYVQKVRYKSKITIVSIPGIGILAKKT